MLPQGRCCGPLQLKATQEHCARAKLAGERISMGQKYSSATISSLILLLLLSSSVHIADCRQDTRCGTVRFALGQSLGYSISTAADIHSVSASAQLHINTKTGDVYCKCLHNLQEAGTVPRMLELSLLIISGKDELSVVVNFTHPCLIATCQQGMPLQPSAFTAAVRLQTPSCARHVYTAVHKLEESLAIETRTEPHLTFSKCRADDYAKLLVSSTVRPHKRKGPVLILTEALPLHLMSCTRGHTQPLSLRPLAPSFPPSDAPLLRLPRQSGVNSPPEFDRLHYTVEVLENSPLDTSVTTVQASDPEQSQLTYSMTSNDISNQELFSIDRQSGLVTSAGSLDRETAEQYVFTVTAEDDSGETTSVLYTFRITDENDNSPTFQGSTFHTLAVPEDQLVGSTLLDLRVVDEDAGSNGLVSYQLLNSTGEVFGVVASGPSGQQALLQLMRALDRELLACFLLTLVAMDGGSPSHTSSATIEVTVLDVADNPPQFNATSYNAVVPEDSSLGLYILTVHATTPDSPQVASISYYIVGGDPSGRFRLGLVTGELTLFQRLDFEATELYALTVQAQSGPGASLRTQVTVTVDVTNVNDHVPTYSRTQYTISISESAAMGQHVIGVSAEDLDSGEFGQVTYRIVSADSSVLETFDLDSTTGSISTSRALDREQQDMYEFSVVAEDGGEPPLTGSVQVVVRVEDVNDQPPMFTATGYEASVPENATSGTVVETVVATDSDSETTSLEYFLQAGNVQGRFSLDRTLGLLSTHGTLDREETALYNLTVVASDGQLESSVQVIITITDVNDRHPIFPTNFYVVSELSESLPPGAEVLLVEAVDQDSGSNGWVSYSSPNLPPPFLLNANSGVITLGLALDYERERYHSFDITARDLGTPSLSSTAHVEITVKDENDNRPEFLPGSRFGSVPENSAPHTSVLQLVAHDADSGSNAILSYSIIMDTTAMQAFTIDGSGVIRTQRELDREVRELYQLVVEVRDQGEEPLAATTSLEVMILDEIDYSPVFSQVTYDVRLTELTPQNMVVVNVSAVTLDAVDSAILYFITGGQNRSLFRIDQSTGAISTAITLDPQLHSGAYRLTVTALHHHLSESVPVLITLAVEDGTPRLGPLSLYLNTLASLLSSNPWRLGAVQVLQRREELQYAFSLQPSPPRIHRYFTIDSTLGEISAAGGTPSGYYTLNVSVSASTGTGYGLVEVYVHVLTNATLEAAVVATFGDSSEIGFASIQLERFAQFLSNILPCTRQQIEIFGIQTRPAQPSIVDVAFAIRTADLQNYLFPETILDRLLANLALARPPLLQFTPSVCVGDPCPNLQQCQPVVQLYRHSPQVASKVLRATELLYLSHPFAPAFTCTCPQGYSSEGLCGSEINECASSPCHFGAVCEDLIADYRCGCPQHTLGKNCSVVCPSQSCQPCAASPCLHDSSCWGNEGGTYSCTSCPWEEEYQGPNCELTSLHFIPGGFAVFPPLGSMARANISFRFATLTPTGVLLYNGQVGGSHDYIAAELVIGQLQVSVSLGGGPVILKTESAWQLNDGQWHSVLLQLDPQGLAVFVSGCSSEPQYVQGAVESCHLWAPLPDTGARTLDVNGPLYIGGVEPYHMPLPLAISTFVGCLSTLARDGVLIDLATPTRSYGVKEGCPPLGAECSSGECNRGECIPVWNGTLCSCEGDEPLCQNSGSSIHLSGGFLQLQEEGSTTTIDYFSMALRTRGTSAVLAQFGSSATLEVRHGSVVYRRSQSSDNTALTLAVDAFVSDGLWHRVELRAETFSTTLSVDDGRVSHSRPEGGRVSVNSIVLGAQDPSSASDHLLGCLGSLILNLQPLDLARALTDGSLGQYSISSANASIGCGSGDPCGGVVCPTHSTCDPGWQAYSCVCDSGFLQEEGLCVDPCTPNPCTHGGACITVLLETSAVFHCQCQRPYQGPTCDEVDNSCPEGFGPTPACQRCLCAPEGVEDGVCDDMGQCLCRDDLLLFSQSGDLGCQSCDCHTPSSTSPNCDARSGQCECVSNVEGRRCDRCAEGYAGLDAEGCKRAQVVIGSFSLAGVAYTNTLTVSTLASRLSAQLEDALTGFGLAGLQEATITAVSNSSGLARMQYRVSVYLPRDLSPLSLPSTHTLAAAMQSLVQLGWVGSYQTTPGSHLLLMSCDANPCDPRAQCSLDPSHLFTCGPCSGGSLDGLICRATLPQGCSGVDTDGDALPDTCDNCPYVFNPGQDEEACAQLEGACPAGVASHVLWSPTAAGSADSKPCPSPLTGSVVRRCEEGGMWGEVSMAGCVSVLGQQLQAEVLAISGGRLPTDEQLLFSLTQLLGFSSSADLSVEDVRVAVVLWVELVGVWVVLVEGGMTGSAMPTLEDLASTASILLDPRLGPQWVGGAAVGGAAEDVLQAVEQLTSTASTQLPLPLTVDREHLVIEILALEDPGERVFTFSAPSGRGSMLDLPPLNSSLPRPLVAVAYLLTIGQLLPRMHTFATPTGANLSVAGPVVSVSVNGGTLDTPITLTLGHSRDLVRYEDGDAICVFWEYGESGGWSQEGCWVVALNATHTVCQCSHLTAFAVLLPEDAFQVSGCTFPECYSPAVFTYIVLGAISAPLLATWLVLAWISSIQGLQTTVHKHQVAALTLTGLVFLVGVGRTEVEGVCAVLAVVLDFLLLACLCWMLAGVVLVARSLLSPQPKTKFATYLYIIGWAIPLLLCGIPVGVVGIISDSFVEDLGYPHYCWFAPEVAWVFAAPAVLLVVVDVVFLVVAVWLQGRPRAGGDSSTSRVGAIIGRDRARASLCVSGVLLGLFVFTWVLGLLAVYGQPFKSPLPQLFESGFAILYATMGGFVFIVFCLNNKVREACWSKLRHKDENSSLQATLASSSILGRLNYQPPHRGRVGGNRMAFHNTLGMFRDVSPPSSFTPNSTLTHITQAEDDLSKSLSLRAAPLPPSPSPTPPPLPPPLTQSTPLKSTTSQQQQPWFIIPEATPLSPLTYGSDADISSDFSERDSPTGDGDNISATLSDLYRQARGQESPESYLERPEKQPSSPRGTEDPLWYRQRDSISQFEVLPMPYETAVKPPLSPQRSVRWRDLEETDGSPYHPDSSAGMPEQHCLCSSKVPSSTHSSLEPPHRTTGPSPEQYSLTEHPNTVTPDRVVGPPSRQPQRVAGNDAGHTRSSLQRPHPTHHDTVPGMSRTASNNVPRHIPPHAHIHRHTSEAASHTVSPFPPPQVSHTSSWTSSHLPSTLQSHTGATASSLSENCQTPGSKASEERVGDCYHSNGPYVEGHLSQVIRHADGSETHQSLV